MHTHMHTHTYTHKHTHTSIHTYTALSSNMPTLTAEDISTDGVILQRYPTTDRKEAALPAGIAMVWHTRVNAREREREREREGREGGERRGERERIAVVN